MSGKNYERLSARDNLFLVAEEPTNPMHVAALQILELEELGTATGGLDIDRYAQWLEINLQRIPRLRQKLKEPFFGGRPVWIDDAHFDLANHVRHVRLPRPGGREQLRREASRIVELPLDRSGPLWEMWLIEGLEDGEHFALLSKFHHCMLDGAAGADLATVFASPDSEARSPRRQPFHPKPAPSSFELFRDAWSDRMAAPLRAVKRGFALRGDALERFGALRELAADAMHRSSATPLNGQQSQHRNVDWLGMPLTDLREVKRALRCSLNDLVLAIVTGAVRRYLVAREIDPRQIDFRVVTPVNMRTEEERGQLGNFVSSWVVPLPVGECDLAARLEAICKSTFDLKESRAALGIDTLLGITQWLPEAVVALGARAAAGPVNMIVTNVPGPQVPLYQLGSKLLGIYPLVPCLPRSGLGVAVFSYDGQLCWGLNADPDLVPDLSAFSGMLRDSFDELSVLANVQSGRGQIGRDCAA